MKILFRVGKMLARSVSILFMYCVSNSETAVCPECSKKNTELITLYDMWFCKDCCASWQTDCQRFSNMKCRGDGEMVSYNARTHEETALCFEFESQSLHYFLYYLLGNRFDVALTVCAWNFILRINKTKYYGRTRRKNTRVIRQES